MKDSEQCSSLFFPYDKNEQLVLEEEEIQGMFRNTFLILSYWRCDKQAKAISQFQVVLRCKVEHFQVHWAFIL